MSSDFDDIRAEYLEVPIAEVMRYFAKDFKPANGLKLSPVPPGWFIDPHKEMVIFKMYVTPLAAKKNPEYDGAYKMGIQKNKP